MLAHKSDGDASSGSPSVGAYGIRGRRPNMEDRIISGVVKLQGKGGNVAINAVLDGHGGQVGTTVAAAAAAVVVCY